ncbi:MAG: ATP-dependent helicase, partial [Planctomycetes bacterium]|nr:ATP-dependent helicase [Planctomycetota bacterium]
MSAEDIQAALEFWRKRESQQASVREIVQMALGAASPQGGIRFEGIQATGWIADFLAQLEGRAPFQELASPEGFHGALRPYQVRGYSWLSFLRQWGLGACLADDMGLGKTIQALALIQRDWPSNGKRPSLLICPMSVVGNWQKEAARFTPDLPVLVHHGLDRTRGPDFEAKAREHALVISSYALLHRDFEMLKAIPWAGVILDEAQNIKNPETRQAKAARALQADYRIALTGTPVENNVGDLWSILEFLNPGFLGAQAEFKRTFFIPIQANRDPEAMQRLKRLSGPFILRRLKTDKTIIADLPEKMEMNVFCTLTQEQASLYSAVVKDASEALDSTTGIQRKGVVLATLMKLKQVCNHPAQFLGDNSPLPGRSGKLARLTEMLEEMLEVGDRALLFTQFSEMGELLRRHLQDTFGREVLFLHGGVPKK